MNNYLLAKKSGPALTLEAFLRGREDWHGVRTPAGVIKFEGGENYFAWHERNRESIQKCNSIDVLGALLPSRSNAQVSRGT